MEVVFPLLLQFGSIANTLNVYLVPGVRDSKRLLLLAFAIYVFVNDVLVRVMV